MPTLKMNLEGYFNGPRTLKAGTSVIVSVEDRKTGNEVLLEVEGSQPPSRIWANRAAYRKAIGEQVPDLKSGE